MNASTIKGFLASLPGRRVAVVGDVILDERHEGTIERICPEAPVPVLRATGAPVVTAGGAANVCRQLQALGMRPALFSCASQAACALLEQEGISTADCRLAPADPVKRRFFAGERCLLRYDVEAPGRVDDGLRQHLLEHFTARLPGYDTVVFSDYGKGVFDERGAEGMMRACQERGIETVVDPKRLPPHVWHGATVFKPNAAEALNLTGAADLEAAGWRLRGKTDAAVVITRAAQGPLVFAEGECHAVPDGAPVAPRNVSGAGDCFTAFLAAALPLGLTTATQVAHAAASLYVSHPRGAPVAPHELLGAVDPLAAKLAPDLAWLRGTLAGKRVVVAPGTFRLPHPGHFGMLRWARQQGDALVVALNTDASVRRLKPGTKLLPWEERATALADLVCVDYVVPFAEDTPEAILRALRPAAQVKGPDYAGREVAGHALAPVLIAPPGAFTYHARDLEAVMG